MEGIEYKDLTGNDAVVSGIAYDSRAVQKGDVYFALKGENFDGAQFIPDAIERGCSAVVSVDYENTTEVPVLTTPDTRLALAYASSAFYGNPSRNLKLIGITGTNGKTSVAHILRYMLQSAGCKTAILGTVGHDYGEGIEKSSLTTPEAPELNRFLRKAVNEGSSHAVMEVSSHSLALKRVRGLDFDVAVFTNLTHDHLDYHKNFESYRNAKGLLFKELKDSAYAVINIDDESSNYMSTMTSANVATFSISDSSADYQALSHTYSDRGMKISLSIPKGALDIESPLSGEFNVYNLMAAFTAVEVLGVNTDSAVENLTNLSQIPGRFEKIDSDAGFTIIVDYAHTPDALENTMIAAGELRAPDSRLITVFGCGGDRDVEKRPIMGKLASSLSDLVIVTSDNPRSEPPESIISGITQGMNKDNFKAIEDRRSAIGHALAEANSGDVVLVAGKGHEDYQEINGVRKPFSDKEVIKELLGNKG